MINTGFRWKMEDGSKRGDGRWKREDGSNGVDPFREGAGRG